MRGVHQKAIKELMGHETLAMTDRYMHLSPVHLHDAANQFYAGGCSDGGSSVHSRSPQMTHSGFLRRTENHGVGGSTPPLATG